MSVEMTEEKIDVSRVDEIVGSYEGQTGILLSILHDIQSEYNYLPRQALAQVAARLEIPLSRIYRLASFYNAFSLQPRGEHLVNVCLGTACHVRGAPGVLEAIERELEIAKGETTPDRNFSLETVNCLGACALGPIVVIDGEYFGGMNTAKVAKLLKKYRK